MSAGSRPSCLIGQVALIPLLLFTIISLATRPSITSAASAPGFTLNPFQLRHAVAGSAYSGKLQEYARDPDGDPLTFAKVTGPAWLVVNGNGSLAGTPSSANVGAQSFTVRATDSGGLSASATLLIQVYAPGAEAVDGLTVMSYNMWHGSTQVANGYRKGIDAILLAGADVIGLQEQNNTGTRSAEYAAALGWYAYDTGASAAILSRYPIVATYDAGNGHAYGVKLRLTNSPLKEVIIWSVHLTAYPYGPYSACFDHDSLSTILNEETSSGRMGQIQAALSSMSGQLSNADSIPVFLTGDFNAPSHQDWIATTANAHCGYSVQWPVTRAVTNAGMTDSFRQAHPDPAALPGNTWSPIFKFNDGQNQPEPQDRIDYIYFKGSNLTLLDSHVFTTRVENPAPNHQNNTWPSDHAALVSSFGLKSGTLAKLTVTPGTTPPGGTVTVSWSGVSGPAPTDWVGLYTPGAADSPSIDWKYASSCARAAGATPRAAGSCTFTMPSNVGAYEFRLFANDGYNRLATSAQVSVSTTPTPTSTSVPPTPTRTSTPPPSINLALNKTASGSAPCNATTETAAKAVDGLASTKFCSGAAGTKTLQVDLGASASINSFTIKHAGAGGENVAWNTRDFSIQTSADSVTWSTAVTISGNTASQTSHPIAARSARYVRLNITAPASDGNPAARIYELEVYGTSAPPTATRTRTSTSTGGTPTATRTRTSTTGTGSTPTAVTATRTRTNTAIPPTATRTNTSTTGNPAWAPGVSYATGARVSYGGLNYQCLQSHTSQTGWEPPNVPALWQQV